MKQTLKKFYLFTGAALFANMAIGQTVKYRLIKCEKVIILESSAGTRDISHNDAANGLTLAPNSYLTAKHSETLVEIITPRGKGSCTLPYNKRMKVSEIENSGVCVFSEPISIRDVATRMDKSNNTRRIGGTKLAVKEAEYTDSEDPTRQIKNLNDSLYNVGVRDSAVYYLYDGFYLEQAGDLPMARTKYNNAMAYSNKKKKDTIEIRAINDQFLQRTSIPTKKKENVNDFFKK